MQRNETSLQGRLVILRRPEYKDAEVLYKWYNDPEFRKLYGVDLISTMEQIEKNIEYYQMQDIFSAYSLLFIIINRRNGEPLGVAFLDHISDLHKHARFGIGIAEKTYRKRGFGFDTVVALLDFTFYKLYLHRAWTEVYKHNRESITACLKFGFRNEGVMRDHIQINNCFSDLVLFSILENEYRSLTSVNKWRARLQQEDGYNSRKEEQVYG